jgi:multisubunit Na+/H+ antiporter MnhF subunit
MEKYLFWGEKLKFSFCEGKYFEDEIICEPVNAITSLWMCVLSVIGLFSRNYITRDIQLLYILQFICGIGSAMFHLSLHKGWQCVDEISMILLVIIGYKFLNDQLLNNYIQNVNITFITNICYTVFLVYYGIYTIIICSIDPNHHKFRDLFTLIFMSLIFQIIGITYLLNNQLLRNHVKKMFLVTVTGGLCWVFDEKFCNYYTYHIYLHSFWHILIGLSTIYLIEFLFMINLLNSEFELYQLKYVLGFIPIFCKKQNLN